MQSKLVLVHLCVLDTKLKHSNHKLRVLETKCVKVQFYCFSVSCEIQTADWVLTEFMFSLVCNI